MMKVTVGMLAGLCPSEGIRLIREYLHIHHLSHYPAYTHTLLEWLQSAIDMFWSMLRHPQGPWVRNSLVSPDYEPQRLHYFSYYVASVHAKGALLSYSTDRTEIHHKPFKRTWQMSNKNGDAEMIILKQVIHLTAFQEMVSLIDNSEQTATHINTLDDPVDIQMNPELESEL